MRSILPSPFLSTLSLVFFSAVAQAIVVTLPTSLSDWDITGSSPIYIQWALYPLTFPAPASQFFDIYIRNGVGGMYEPSLNQSLALSVDASTATYYEVPASEAIKFVVGTGYQLFFSDPNDASVVYCDSEVFSIGVNPPAVNPTSTSSSASSTDTPDPSSSTSFIDSSSSTESASSSNDLSPSSSTDLSTSTELSTSPTASPSSTSSEDENRIVAATVPGGAAQQGQNLLFSAGSRLSFGGASIAAAIVAAGLLLLA